MVGGGENRAGVAVCRQCHSEHSMTAKGWDWLVLGIELRLSGLRGERQAFLITEPFCCTQKLFSHGDGETKTTKLR